MPWRLSLFACYFTILTLTTEVAPASSAQRSCRKLRLGGAIALSGKYALNGKACEQGWTMWAERVNARGGLHLAGNLSCLVHLPLDLRDDGSSALSSKDILKDMLDPKSPDFADLDFVIGPFSSGITKGNAQVARDAGRVLFSHGASESLYNQGNQYIFSTLTPGGLYMASGLSVLFANGARSVVFAHEEKSFSKSVCYGGRKTADQLGMKVLGYFEYPTGKTNFADIVYDIKKLGADVYVGCGHIDDITYLIGNANVLNVNPSALLVTHASDTRIVKNIGIQYSHGLLSPTQWDKHLNFADEDGFFGSAQNFNEAFAKRWGSEPAYASAYAAAMGYALQKAIENANSYDTDAVRQALLALSVNSFYGPIKFSSPGDPSGLVGTMPSRKMVTTQIFNGSVEVVAPEAAASEKLLYPLPTWSERQVMLHPCTLGYFEKGTDLDGSAICAPCPLGQYRDKFSAMCVLCQPGQIASKAGASSCKPCPAATHSAAKFGSSTCLQCPSGAFCSEGSWEPAPCPPGHFCLPGHVLPTPCPDGTYRDETGGRDETGCLHCQPGHFSDRAGMVKCLPCAAGWHTPYAGQRVCQACPLSTYQASQGQTNCTACPPTFVTHFTGADSAAACVCKRTFFLNRATGRCEKCPVGAVCPGGSSIPYIKEGFYAELKGDPNRSVGDPDAFSGLLVWACPQPTRTFCPGRSLPSPAEEGDDMLNGVRLPDECPPNHHGVACAWCNDGRFFDGSQCAECGPYANVATMIAILISGLITSAGLYKFVGRPVPKNFVGMMMLANVAGLAVTFFSILSLLLPLIPAKDSGNSFFTDASTSTASRVFVLDVPFWQPDCIFTNNFPTAYGKGVAIPLLIIAAFFCNWLISVLLHLSTGGRVPKMSFDHSVNVCGLVLQALYIGMCKVGLSYYLCRSNASAPDTLVAYPAVICASDDHNALAPVGILTIALYMIGIFGIMLYLCIVAPERYLVDARFRSRVRFLVQKWRPDKWYWSMVYMMRNVAITLVPIFVPQDASVQCSLMLIVLIVSMIALALNRPWRDHRGNYADLATTLILCCLCIFCFLFSPEQEGVTNVTTAWLETAIKTLYCFVAATLLLSMGYAVRLLINHMQRSESRQAFLRYIATDLISLGKKLDSCDPDRLTESFGQFTQVDLADIVRALGVFTHCNSRKVASQYRKSPTSKMIYPGARPTVFRQYASIAAGDTIGSVLAQARQSSKAGDDRKASHNEGRASTLILEQIGDYDSAADLGRGNSSTDLIVEHQLPTRSSLHALPRLLDSPLPEFVLESSKEIKIDDTGFSCESTKCSQPSAQCVGDRGPMPGDILDMWSPKSSSVSSALLPTCVGYSTL